VPSDGHAALVWNRSGNRQDTARCADFSAVGDDEEKIGLSAAAENHCQLSQLVLLFRSMNRTQLSQLAVLSAVAAQGSFRGAAKELGIAPSAVSHAVASLEASLGIRLLARTTRSVAATEEGRRLLERLRPALDEIAHALELAADARERPAGNLRVTAPRFAADLILAPRLGAFLARYPDIVLEIANEDGFTDIVEEGYDAGIRLGESLEADMIAVKVGPDLTSAVVAAPSYFERFPRPLHPRDLAARSTAGSSRRIGRR
jgi:DNA-binding transcriptional LysR family regulator